MDEATNGHRSSARSKDPGKQGDVILPLFPFLYNNADNDGEKEDDDNDDDDDSTDNDLATFGVWVKPPLPPSLSAPRTMKVTMPFMRAYKALRGPRDAEPSPLFSCLRDRPGERAEGHGNNVPRHLSDPFVLAGCDEVKFLNQVNDALEAEDYDDIDDDDVKASVYRRRLQALIDDEEDAGNGTSTDNADRRRRRRQTVFYFEPPVAPPLTPNEQLCRGRASHSPSSCGSCCSCSDCSSCSSCRECCEVGTVADHVFDGAHLDAGWLASGAGTYVSDDDGPPADTRLTPAVFRALAAGCTRDDVDGLRLRQQPKLSDPVSSRFRTPRTPPNKRTIVDDNHADNDDRLNNVRPHRHRRQFDMHTGEELSPLYRVERGSGGDGVGPAVWSPPGLGLERAGFLLRERRPWLSDGGDGGGVGSSGNWSLLFQRMAPAAYQALRTRLYGDAVVDGTPEQHSSSGMTSNSANPQRRRVVTGGPRGQRSDGQAEQDEEPEKGEEDTDEQTEAAQILLAMRNSWQAVEAAKAEDARLEAAHAQAEAILTAQARCLTRLEHVREIEKQNRSSIRSSRTRSNSGDQGTDGSPTESLPESPSRRTQKPSRRQRRIASALRLLLQELRIRVREAEARVDQGWERQRVLAQRVQQGEARLAREAAGGTAAAAAQFLNELAEELAQLGVAGWA